MEKHSKTIFKQLAYKLVSVYDWVEGLEANKRIYIFKRESVPLVPKI